MKNSLINNYENKTGNKYKRKMEQIEK